MGQFVLISGLSVLLFGTCSPSSDHEGRLVELKESVVERQADQADILACIPPCHVEAYKALLAKQADVKERGVLRMEKQLSSLKAIIDDFEKEVDDPEAEARHARLLQKYEGFRFELERHRAAWKRMVQKLAQFGKL